MGVVSGVSSWLQLEHSGLACWEEGGRGSPVGREQSQECQPREPLRVRVLSVALSSAVGSDDYGCFGLCSYSCSQWALLTLWVLGATGICQTLGLVMMLSVHGMPPTVP